MMFFIPTHFLSKEDLPENDDWDSISTFAITYDIAELGAKRAAKIYSFKELSEEYSLSELRARLYIEQRRWNHFGRLPDAESLSFILELFHEIKRRVSCCPNQVGNETEI